MSIVTAQSPEFYGSAPSPTEEIKRLAAQIVADEAKLYKICYQRPDEIEYEDCAESDLDGYVYDDEPYDDSDEDYDDEAEDEGESVPGDALIQDAAKVLIGKYWRSRPADGTDLDEAAQLERQKLYNGFEYLNGWLEPDRQVSLGVNVDESMMLADEEQVSAVLDLVARITAARDGVWAQCEPGSDRMVKRAAQEALIEYWAIRREIRAEYGDDIDESDPAWLSGGHAKQERAGELYEVFECLNGMTGNELCVDPQFNESQLLG